MYLTGSYPQSKPSSECNAGCQIHLFGNRATSGASRFTFWRAPDSWDWKLKLGPHVLFDLPEPCIMRLHVCVWVSVCIWWKRWSCGSHGGSGLSLSPCVSPGRPLCSWERHCSISDSILGVWQSNTESSDARPTRGHPRAKDRWGRYQPRSKECCFAVRNSLRFMTQPPVLQKEAAPWQRKLLVLF